MGESTTEITLTASAKVGPSTDQERSRHHSSDLSICSPPGTLIGTGAHLGRWLMGAYCREVDIGDPLEAY